MRSDKKLLQKIFNSSLGTIILSELAFSVCSVIDGILSGQYLGDTALAAIGICAPFPSILAVFSGILSAGCQARCSYYMGRGEKDNANSVFSTVILVSMLFSALMTFVIVVFTVPAAEILGAAGRDAELHDGTVDYLRACAIGTVGMIMDTILWPIVQLEGKHLHMRAAVIVLAGMNIIGDLLNMFVFGGGLFDVGLVTAISYICASCTRCSASDKECIFFVLFPTCEAVYTAGAVVQRSPKGGKEGLQLAQSDISYHTDNDDRSRIGGSSSCGSAKSHGFSRRCRSGHSRDYGYDIRSCFCRERYRVLAVAL